MLRDILWVAAGRLVGAAVALAGIRLATLYLPPDEYGRFSLLMSFWAFSGLLIVSPVGQHINRQTHAWWDEGTLFARLRSFRWWVLGASALAALAGGLWFLGASGADAGGATLASAALFAMVLLGTWNGTLAYLLNMLGYRAYSAATGIVTVCTGLLAAWLLAAWWPSGTLWFAGQAAGMAVGTAAAAFMLAAAAGARARSGSLPFADRGTLIDYCLPLALAAGFMWLQVSGYRLVLEQYWGLAQLGTAAVGLGIATQLLGLFESLAMQFLYPYFFRGIGAGDATARSAVFSDLLNTLGPLYLVFVGALVAGAYLLLAVLAHAQYEAAGLFVALGAAIECARVLANLFSAGAQVGPDARAVVPPWASGALVCMLLIALAAALDLDIAWAGAALAAGGVVLLAVMALRIRRVAPFALDGARWAAGLAALPAGLAVLLAFPQTDAGLAWNLVRLFLIGALAALAGWALLRNNPALARLLAVRLRPD